MLIAFIVMGFFCVGIYRIYLYTIHLCEKTRFLIPLFVAAAFLNVAINFILIPKVGIIGAAISTFVAYGVLMILVMIVAMKLFPLRFRFVLFGKILVAAVGMCMVLSLFDLNSGGSIVGAVIIGMLVYFVLLGILASVGRESWLRVQMRRERKFHSRRSVK